MSPWRAEDTGGTARWGAARKVAPALLAAALFAGLLGSTAACHPERKPKPRPPAGAVALADALLDSGDYGRAAAGYEGYLALHPNGKDADRALFQLGLLYALPQSTPPSPTASREHLTTLLSRFPKSPYAAQTRSLLALLDEIDRLNRQAAAQKEAPEDERLALADAAFAAGDPATAAAGYEAYLSDHPLDEETGRVLFRLGLLYNLDGANPPSPSAGRDRLRRLVTEDPDSPYTPQARALLGMLDQIDRLRGEARAQRRLAEELKRDLEALKRIDLGRPGSP